MSGEKLTAAPPAGQLNSDVARGNSQDVEESAPWNGVSIEGQWLLVSPHMKLPSAQLDGAR